MEFVIIYIVIAVILCMLTRRLFFLIFAVLSVFMLIVLAMNVYFCYMTIGLLMSKRRKGSFVRVENENENAALLGKNISYKVAVYDIDGVEYKSVFPAEGAFNVYFYSTKKRCSLWLNKKRGRVFDMYNVVSCIVWPLFSSMSCVGMGFIIVFASRMGL